MNRPKKRAWMRLTSPDLLRATMGRRKFSLERLSRYAGCSKSMISHLTSGRKKSCTRDLAEKIAEALDVPVELLFVPGESTQSGHSVPTKRSA